MHGRRITSTSGGSCRSRPSTRGSAPKRQLPTGQTTPTPSRGWPALIALAVHSWPHSWSAPDGRKPARRARIQGRDRAGEGHLHAELGVSPAEAFRLLSRYSQNNNRRVRKISAGLVQGLIAAAEFRPPAD